MFSSHQPPLRIQEKSGAHPGSSCTYDAQDPQKGYASSCKPASATQEIESSQPGSLQHLDVSAKRTSDPQGATFSVRLSRRVLIFLSSKNPVLRKDLNFASTHKHSTSLITPASMLPTTTFPLTRSFSIHRSMGQILAPDSLHPAIRTPVLTFVLPEAPAASSSTPSAARGSCRWLCTSVSNHQSKDNLE